MCVYFVFTTLIASRFFCFVVTLPSAKHYTHNTNLQQKIIKKKSRAKHAPSPPYAAHVRRQVMFVLTRVYVCMFVSMCACTLKAITCPPIKRPVFEGV